MKLVPEPSALGLLLAGTEEQKRLHLPLMASGERIGCFCLTEPEAGSDAASVRTTAVRDGDSYVLNGEKIWITNADIADYFTVMATVDRSLGSKGLTAFWIERDTPGLRVGRLEPKMGLHGTQVAEVEVEAAVGRVAVATARRRVEGKPLGAGLALQRALADALVFKKIRARLGGNMQFMISGGAPLSAKINQFFNGAGLNILEGYDLAEMGHNSAAYLHHLTESMKLAYADRGKYLGDPDFADIPVAQLIDPAYAARQRTLIDSTRATPSPPSPAPPPSSTTCRGGPPSR